MKVLDVIVTVLLIIGALNWGVIGIFGFNAIGALLGEASAFTRLIYTVVGLAGLYEAFTFTVGFDAMHHRWCELPAKH